MTRNPNAWLLSDLDVVPRNGIKVFTTFSCGGGSSMGYKRAGCEVVAANDIDPQMQKHYVANLKPKHYYLCPIRDLIGRNDLEQFKNIDILDGSPPCSTFSMTGNRESDWGKEKHFREGQAKQVLSDLFFDFLDLAENLKPKVIIAENVEGMLRGQAKGYCKLVVTRMREMGYRPQVFLLNAADCGVPQRRKRVFFCAVRDDVSKATLSLNPTSKWVSCLEACCDVQQLTKDETADTQVGQFDKKWWPLTRKGDSYQNALIAHEGRTGNFSQIRLNEAYPSCTLVASHHNFKHWDTCRFLTLREFKRLGSFPDDYWCESASIGKYMIGMSVPPKMTEYVARQVCSQWFGVKS
jgi:DNA (cytosine-5)-methyltransferase 1